MIPDVNIVVINLFDKMDCCASPAIAPIPGRPVGCVEVILPIK